MAGEVVHMEFPSADADRAQAFWGGLFGWKFGDSGMPGMDYRMAQVADGVGAAVFASENRSGHPNIYLDTDNIDESIEKVRELGGEADDRAPVPGHGWFASCRDCEGTAFHLWQSDSNAS
jgi:predicted enzyme related to lactoylglutathione lyase